MKATVEMTLSVDIEIPDDLVDKVFGPPIENQDENGVPQPYVRGGSGWRNYLYDLDTVEKVLQHLAFNGSINGFGMDQMEGWLFDREQAGRVVIQWPDILDNDVTVTEGASTLNRYRETG